MGIVFGTESKPVNMSEEVKPGVSYTIGGVKVEFPVKAYPSQISMMDKIIRGCHRGQNCLLESPTGSGKTLALLCGSVAWQRAESKKLYDLAVVEHQKRVQQMLQTLQESSGSGEKMAKSNDGAAKPAMANENAEKEAKLKVGELGMQQVFGAPTRSKFKYDDESDEDSSIFRPDMKKMKTGDAPSPIVVDLTEEGDTQDITDQNPKPASVVESPKKENEFDSFAQLIATSTPARPKVPKIFFATRTHKQIAQVLHELRRTAYADIKSCILSSRVHSCIHPLGSKPNVNRNELCQQLIDPRTHDDCRFYHNVKRFTNSSILQSHGVPSVWDLEDLIKFGKEKSCCPYFTARELMGVSDVILCPYNYLLDPLIRASMGISLTGNILILDEAHNIEDTCRESASLSVSQDSILDAIHNCEEVAPLVSCEELYRDLIKVLSSMSLWIDHHRKDVTDLSDYDVGKWMLFGPQAVESFDSYEFGRSNLANFESSFDAINQLKGDENSVDSDSMAGSTKNLISGLILILKYLYDEKHTRDYHVALTKSFSNEYSDNHEADNQGWFNMKRKRNRVAQWRYSINFWCLNPSVVFEEIREEARSVVLTSGTLSPMDSFQSELGATFPITLEANHVIDPSQCLIRSLGFGPNNVCLDGKYASTNTYPFQDEIAQIILQISSFVPHGILCFVPSYSLLDKLHERWRLTGMLEKIARHKEIICEPRKSIEFEPMMKEFYETIERTSQTPVGQGVTGALILAVCRGKVSEGLDFADKNARVIITIGIPYPNVKDSQVNLKKSYNDQHKVSKGLLSGRDWYQIQAYRALNQALGRCIRHRNDWGAILLFDNRFSNNYYYKSLSKWVRNKVQHHSNYNDLIHQLQEFIQCRLQIDRETK